MSAMHTTTQHRFWRGLPWLAAFLLLWAASAAFAQQPDDDDPPARAAHLSYRSGSVVFAPQDEDDWTELPQNRPLTIGDRLWTDRGSRAELDVGGATLHLGGESHLGVSTLDDNAVQVILQQGSMQARVRDLQQGDNFEIGTPNLAFRALQPGEYRIDVDTNGQTRGVVLSGAGAVFGEGGESVNLGAGQQATFAGRFLARVQGPAYQPDELGRWAAERNRAEDQSVTARHVPRNVVGYAQLDQHGSWDNHPQYGAVWYPTAVAQDWAPYRQGRWTYVRPWGWTWVDEAPWGFAPFHYGRWAQIGPRWAWVPGRIAPRPVYSPALVVFMGGAPGVAFTVRSGPAVGWFPLAPGEAWWPAYRVSPRYVSGVNFSINLTHYHRNYTNYYWRTRPYAVSAVRVEDFRFGRPVYRARQPVDAAVIARVRIGYAPDRPNVREIREQRQAFGGAARLQASPPSARVVAAVQTERARERRALEERREARREERDRAERRDDRKDDSRAQREDRKDDRRVQREDRKDARPDTRQERAERRDDRKDDRRDGRADQRQDRQEGRAEQRQDRQEGRAERRQDGAPVRAEATRQQPQTREERLQQRQQEREERLQQQQRQNPRADAPRPQAREERERPAPRQQERAEVQRPQQPSREEATQRQQAREERLQQQRQQAREERRREQEERR